MMIIMHPGAPKEQIQNVIAEIENQKLSSHIIEGVEQTIIGAVGDGHYVAKEIFEALPGVMELISGIARKARGCGPIIRARTILSEWRRLLPRYATDGLTAA